MHKFIVLFFIFILLSPFGLAKPTAQSGATVTIVSTETALKEYKALTTKADTLRVVDSLFQTQTITAQQTFAVGASKDLVLQVLGQPLEVIILPDGNRKKWIYKDQFVYFKNNIVEIIQKRNSP